VAVAAVVATRLLQHQVLGQARYQQVEVMAIP
jgi:hypothetical protein